MGGDDASGVPSERSDDDRSAGPVPPGALPSDAEASGGPSPTGHPPTSGDGRDAEPVVGVAEEEGAGAGAPAADALDETEVAEPFEVDLELLLKEREEYLGLSRQLQADFENYKKRMIRQQTEQVERAAGLLVDKLLPVLDNFDLALGHGESALEPVYRSLMQVLEGEGLERLEPVGKPFDPNEHEAVVHEPGDREQPEVSEVLRAGYRWKGKLLRAAMVKVRG